LSQRKHELSLSNPNLFILPAKKTHMVGMIEIITSIVTHTVILESFGFNNLIIA